LGGILKKKEKEKEKKEGRKDNTYKQRIMINKKSELFRNCSSDLISFHFEDPRILTTREN